MKSEHFLHFLILFCWLAGIALAVKKGDVQVFLACIFPPYAFYLVVERVLTMTGFLQ